VCKHLNNSNGKETAEQAPIAAVKTRLPKLLFGDILFQRLHRLWVDAPEAAIGGTLSQLSQGKMGTDSLFSMK
ncbi:hypothetical protein AVEN_70466-1, partial [Araneus ventricosus]